MLGHFGSVKPLSHSHLHDHRVVLILKCLIFLGENNDNAPYLMNASVLALGSPFRGGVVL